MTKYTHLCWQGTIQCSPRGHRTREAADRCAARHNSVLRSLGLLTEANRWIVRANPPRVEDLDYKDLFRDAVLMMAEIARAAGFDPKDENVEPPDIVARVENQRAEVERLTVDLTVARRLLPPRYIAADGSIMDPERCTPHAADCAECGRGRAHDEACLGLAETPAEQVRRLTAGRLAAPDDRHCGSDIYDCEACGFPLDYAITEEGEAANHDGELVCTDCALAYMVDMATGELRRAPALLEAKDAEIARLTAERDAIARALDDDCAPDIDGQQVKTLADRIGALLGHWQDEIRGALCASVPDPHRIDGGGCDSGDPLDLTLAEVAQAVNQLTDQADGRIAALKAERDRAIRGEMFTQEWYATRLETLMEWAKPLGHWPYMAGVLANDGSPPTYARIIAGLHHQVKRAERERDALRADLASAAGELKVPIPEPGTDASRMLLANVLMRRERDAARRDAEERRQPKDTRWFVVHQRDGTPMVDIFSEQGAERAAKLTARFYAAQWTDVYVMTGRPVSSADFEAEATEERAERAADKATS